MNKTDLRVLISRRKLHRKTLVVKYEECLISMVSDIELESEDTAWTRSKED